MFTVEPIERAVVDAWPIDKAGLPVRVVNAARKAGVGTVGALHRMSPEEWGGLRSIGHLTVQQIQQYFSVCDRVERGAQTFLTVQEVFDLFLDNGELAVLSWRYGLMHPGPHASRKFMKLQEIGNELDLTRERIRQIEAAARRKLQSLLALRCLRPFYIYLQAFIRFRGGLITWTDARDLDGQAWLTDYNPCPLMLLLHDIDPSHYTAYRNTFSLWPQETMESILEKAEAQLRKHGEPVPIRQLRDELEWDDAAWMPDTLAKLLHQSGNIAATKDNRYFLFDHASDAFLHDLLLPMERPAHFQALTQRFNNSLQPHCHKGSGYVMNVLNGSPRFVRKESGYYDLAQAGGQ